MSGHSKWATIKHKKVALDAKRGKIFTCLIKEITMAAKSAGGVALLVEVTTDNRNRSVSEIRHAFTKGGGNMGEAGSVSWMFHKKGSIVVSKAKSKEDDLMNIVLEHGGDDLSD